MNIQFAISESITLQIPMTEVHFIHMMQFIEKMSIVETSAVVEFLDAMWSSNIRISPFSEKNAINTNMKLQKDEHEIALVQKNNQISQL